MMVVKKAMLGYIKFAKSFRLRPSSQLHSGTFVERDECIIQLDMTRVFSAKSLLALVTDRR